MFVLLNMKREKVLENVQLLCQKGEMGNQGLAQWQNTSFPRHPRHHKTNSTIWSVLLAMVIRVDSIIYHRVKTVVFYIPERVRMPLSSATFCGFSLFKAKTENIFGSPMHFQVEWEFTAENILASVDWWSRVYLCPWTLAQYLLGAQQDSPRLNNCSVSFILESQTSSFLFSGAGTMCIFQYSGHLI